MKNALGLIVRNSAQQRSFRWLNIKKNYGDVDLKVLALIAGSTYRLPLTCSQILRSYYKMFKGIHHVAIIAKDYEVSI